MYTILVAVLLTLLVGILGNASNGLGGFHNLGTPLAVAVMGGFILFELRKLNCRLDSLRHFDEKQEQSPQSPIARDASNKE